MAAGGKYEENAVDDQWRGDRKTMIQDGFYNLDCFDGFERIDDKSIDMILCDLPYGTTNCEWDIRLPFPPLWKQYERIIKDNGAIVLFSAQPFTTDLVEKEFIDKTIPLVK